MNKALEMVSEPGYVLIGPDGESSCAGFEFNYEHPNFDGCRMGQTAPLFWAQDKISCKLAELSAVEDSHGCEEQTMGVGYSPAEILGHGFASMVIRALPYEYGSEEMRVFISSMVREMQELDRGWTKPNN